MSDPWDPEFHTGKKPESGESHEGQPEELPRTTADEVQTDDDSPEALLHPTAPDATDEEASSA